VLIRNCVAYGLDAEEAALTLLTAAKMLQPKSFLQLAQVIDQEMAAV